MAETLADLKKIGLDIYEGTAFAMSLKETVPFEKPAAEASRTLSKYPERAPVICEKAPRTNLPEIEKKFLVPPRAEGCVMNEEEEMCLPPAYMGEEAMMMAGMGCGAQEMAYDGARMGEDMAQCEMMAMEGQLLMDAGDGTTPSEVDATSVQDPATMEALCCNMEADGSMMPEETLNRAMLQQHRGKDPLDIFDPWARGQVQKRTCAKFVESQKLRVDATDARDASKMTADPWAHYKLGQETAEGTCGMSGTAEKIGEKAERVVESFEKVEDKESTSPGQGSRELPTLLGSPRWPGSPHLQQVEAVKQAYKPWPMPSREREVALACASLSESVQAGDSFWFERIVGQLTIVLQEQSQVAPQTPMSSPRPPAAKQASPNTSSVPLAAPGSGARSRAPPEAEAPKEPAWLQALRLPEEAALPGTALPAAPAVPASSLTAGRAPAIGYFPAQAAPPAEAYLQAFGFAPAQAQSEEEDPAWETAAISTLSELQESVRRMEETRPSSIDDKIIVERLDALDKRLEEEIGTLNEALRKEVSNLGNHLDSAVASVRAAQEAAVNQGKDQLQRIEQLLRDVLEAPDPVAPADFAELKEQVKQVEVKISAGLGGASFISGGDAAEEPVHVSGTE